MIQISEHCSAGCCHCPFKENKIFFSREQILQQVSMADEGFVTLTGGEPLEHPDFLSICEELDKLGVPFRVATGGHLPLTEILDRFAGIQGFLGLNIGSDVMSSRNSDFNLKQAWWRNIIELKMRRISWSLTLTLGHDVDFTNLIYELQNISATPDFLMMNESLVGPKNQSIFKFLKEGPWKHLNCL